MEQAFTLSLQKFFTVKPAGPEKKGPNPRADFYAKYKQESEHADKNFQEKYEEDLNTTLIFVRSFEWFDSTELTFWRNTGRSFLSSNFWLRSQHSKPDTTRP